MHYRMFFLAEDEAGDIIDDGFVFEGSILPRPSDGEYRAHKLCRDWGAKLLDYDGPYASPLWPWLTSNRKPKWDSLLPPGGLDAAKWANRRRFK